VDVKIVPDEVNFGVNSPLSSKHRNISYTSFTETPDRNEGMEREEELRDELNKSYEHHGDASAEVARAHIALAEAFWQSGNRVSATEHYTIAHSIFEYKLGDSESCAVVLKALGDLNKEDQKYEAANELYAEAMEIEMSIHGHCLPSTLNAAGQVCLLEDDFRAAMEYHRRALQIQQQKSLEGGNKFEIYETLVLIGNVYYSERNNLSNIRSKGVDYKDFIELGFLGTIAHAHDMRGEYSKACQFYEESLQCNVSKKRKESKRETALTLNRLGSLNRELGRYEEVCNVIIVSCILHFLGCLRDAGTWFTGH
jgi:tetratricopeptide (TPR) repeat protein